MHSNLVFHGHTLIRSFCLHPQKAGIEFGLVQFPETVTLDDLLKQIQLLNKDNSVHGVLVQLPLPEHIDEAVVIESISPKKDVDG
jgi:5,10-methylene-tetrahydrofolate dehydrogenase/methenyl tetrahydrofolate cyclohydrolase